MRGKYSSGTQGFGTQIADCCQGLLCARYAPKAAMSSLERYWTRTGHRRKYPITCRLVFGDCIVRAHQRSQVHECERGRALIGTCGRGREASVRFACSLGRAWWWLSQSTSPESHTVQRCGYSAHANSRHAIMRVVLAACAVTRALAIRPAPSISPLSVASAARLRRQLCRANINRYCSINICCANLLVPLRASVISHRHQLARSPWYVVTCRYFTEAPVSSQTTPSQAQNRQRQNVMDIEKYMDKRIRVKFAGGREGEDSLSK